MKKIFLLLSILAGASFWSACSDTETYADLVDNEKEYITDWALKNPFQLNFDNLSSKDEDWVKNLNKAVLEDSIHPAKLIELGQWYEITEGDFKRLRFRINSWGNDGLTEEQHRDGSKIDKAAEKEAFRNHKKFFQGKNVLVRYDSLYLLNDFDYENLDNNAKGDNLDPLSFLICYNWTTNYYSSMYYSYYNSTGNSYECTSGGLGFPIRFLWEGGNASIVCPFSLVEKSLSSYYYTLYYGNITYSKPNYLPQ